MATPAASLQATSAAEVSAEAAVTLRDQPRVVLLPLEARAWRRLLGCVIVLGAAWMAKVLISPMLADYLAGAAAGIPALEGALSWQPNNPELRLRLARAYDGTSAAADTDQARHQIEAALRLRPTSSLTWLQLAQQHDGLGERQRAHQALATALRLDPQNVNLRWEAALLALRWGERETSLEHLRFVLAVNPAQADAAFQLASALLDPEASSTSLLPSEPEPLLVLLRLAMRHGDLPLARAAWDRLAALMAEMSATLPRDYLEFLIQQGDTVGARQLWTQIAPASLGGTSDNLVWNGGFERERLRGWGFDWQVRQAWGIEVRLDQFAAAGGQQSLRLAFNSFPTLDFAGVSQRIAVEAGSVYHLRGLAKAQDFTTQSGVKLQVVTADGEQVLGETAAVAGTTPDWVPLEAEVQVPDDISLVLLRVRRERAPGPEGNLGGKVWLDEISLTPAGGASG